MQPPGPSLTMERSIWRRNPNISHLQRRKARPEFQLRKISQKKVILHMTGMILSIFNLTLISEEVKSHLQELTEEIAPPPNKKATMKEKGSEQKVQTTPPKPEGYDIVEVVKNHTENITVGELLQDNLVYRK